MLDTLIFCRTMISHLHRKGSNNQNADALSRIKPCERGENNEPCTHCQRRITGAHSVSAVKTRRQARREHVMNGEGAAPPTAARAAINLQLAAPVATDLASTRADVSVNDRADNSNQRLKSCARKNKQNKNVPVGLLGRTAPMAAKTLDSWSGPQNSYL